MQQTSHYKIIAANHKVAKYKTQNDQLHLQLKCCRENVEKAILELQEQLDQAHRNRPESNTEDKSPEASEATVEDSNTAAELSVEASTHILSELLSGSTM